MTQPRLFHLMHLAHHALFKEADRGLLETLGISSVQLSALFVIKASDGCSMSHVAETLRMNRSAVTTLVQRLEKAGLVRREADAEDGRAARLFITPKGARLVKKGAPLVGEANARLLDGLTAAEARTVEKFLMNIIAGGARKKGAKAPSTPPEGVLP